MPVESLLAEDVDGFALGESVLLHGGAHLGGELGDLRLGVAFGPRDCSGLADGGHSKE